MQAPKGCERPKEGGGRRLQEVPPVVPVVQRQCCRPRMERPIKPRQHEQREVTTEPQQKCSDRCSFRRCNPNNCRFSVCPARAEHPMAPVFLPAPNPCEAHLNPSMLLACRCRCVLPLRLAKAHRALLHQGQHLKHCIQKYCTTQGPVLSAPRQKHVAVVVKCTGMHAVRTFLFVLPW